MYGMEITFRLHELDYSKDEALYPQAQLLIFAETNYVGVYYRESTSRDDHYGEWQHLSCHDSCWRSDGVERFLRRYSDRVATLDNLFYDGWYKKVEITPEFAETLRQITRKRRLG
jgi:hypothetical protein